MSHKHDNTINIPGYNQNVEYSYNFGKLHITQYNFTATYPNRKICFYNEDSEDISYHSECLVAVWRVKKAAN